MLQINEKIRQGYFTDQVSGSIMVNAPDAGMSKKEVLQVMGTKAIQTYLWDPQYGRRKYRLIANPYSVDLKQDGQGNSIQILWYYTDQKAADNAINKDELSPIVLENDKVIGYGWGFFEDYAKRKEIFINMN